MGSGQLGYAAIRDMAVFKSWSHVLFFPHLSCSLFSSLKGRHLDDFF